ncbi:MAG: hypothetical protein DHS20C14_02090 [Phycisphaeraceae bacterium]|nr:MAG: hypothetical protein DHS20C14_02090 [Phycisphaeraceae bacterium]
MGLLREHVLDDAGKRVPVYRTGIWPWRLAHESRLPCAVEQSVLAEGRRGSYRLPRAGMSVFFGAAVVVMVAVVGGFGKITATVGCGGVLGLLIGAILFIDALWRLNPTGKVEGELVSVFLSNQLCPSCGYELISPGRCSECGATWHTKKRLPAEDSRSDEHSD